MLTAHWIVLGWIRDKFRYFFSTYFWMLSMQRVSIQLLIKMPHSIDRLKPNFIGNKIIYPFILKLLLLFIMFFVNKWKGIVNVRIGLLMMSYREWFDIEIIIVLNASTFIWRFYPYDKFDLIVCFVFVFVFFFIFPSCEGCCEILFSFLSFCQRRFHVTFEHAHIKLRNGKYIRILNRIILLINRCGFTYGKC